MANGIAAATVDVRAARRGFNSTLAGCFEALNSVIAGVGLAASVGLFLMLMGSSPGFAVAALVFGPLVTVSFCGIVAVLADCRKSLRIIAAK